jgi:hypothetical protein
VHHLIQHVLFDGGIMLTLWTSRLGPRISRDRVSHLFTVPTDDYRWEREP